MERGAAKAEVFKRVTGKSWSGMEEDFASMQEAEPELVNEYLQGSFFGTCPEFAACFHLKQCLRVLGREDEFGACREAMIQVATANGKMSSWDTFRIQVLQDMLKDGAEVPISPFGKKEKKKKKQTAVGQELSHV
jgi:hypothetical protein